MTRILVLIVFSLVTGSLCAQPGHELSFAIKGLHNDTIQLAYHQGSGMFLQDSAVTDEKGRFVIKGDQPIQPGVYLVVMPNKTYFELIINEPRFSVTTTASDPVSNMQVKGSKENQLFYDYMRFLNPVGTAISEKKAAYEATDDAQQKETLKEEISTLEKKIKAYKEQVVKENPETFVAMMFTAMEDVVVPDPPAGLSEEEQQQFRYRYFRNHFFDNMDLRDARLIRTPFFQKKIDYYFDKMLPQRPDTITREIDRLLKIVEAEKEMFKYLLTYLTTKYQKSKVMGMDEVFVHVGLNYFLTDKVDWFDADRKKKIEEEVMKLRYNLIGNPAINIEVESKEGKRMKLYDIKAEYLVLFFYDVNCGHCKKVAPKLRDVVNKYKGDGVRVFAMPINKERAGWDKFVTDFELEDWVHAWDPQNDTHFRVYYNVFSTPTMYVLDSKKTIIGKKLDTELIDKILSDRINNE